jgi:hypothetical protein
MKTTTKTAAANRLAKTTVSKSSIAYKVVAELLQLPNATKTYKVFGNIIRPVHTSGSGRFTSNMDYTKDIQSLLASIGIETILGNDAPKGGLTGNYLEIITKIK